jgi:P27 family predicted phage terminase small subunit
MKKIEPPRHLKAAARRIWRSLMEDYSLDDAAGLSLLQAACEAFQRAQEARARLDKDGAVIADRFGQLKAHPAAAVERDARGQMIAALRVLKLSPED